MPESDVTFPLSAEAAADPVGVVVARLPQRPGACAQVRSLASAAEAEATAKAISEATNFPTEIMQKDLGDKGVWHRVCVGHEENEARLIAKATRWTSSDGVLAPFLDPPRSPDEPRFHVLPKRDVDARRPTDAQARALLARAPEGNVSFIGPRAAPVIVSATPQRTLVAIDAAGARLTLNPAPPPGCASCAVAEKQSPVIARRPLGAGDVLPAAGDELLVEEETESGARFLAVITVDGTTLTRAGAVLLAQASTDVIMRGEASVVEADGDDDREIAVARLELRVLDGNLCALTTRAELWGTGGADSARGLVRLDPKKLQGTGIIDAITALDGAGDAQSASRACGDALRDQPSSLMTQLCLQRIRALTARGRLIDAVNAAGALAESAPALRAAVAGPLYSAMSALDKDPRLSAAPYDCAAAPLVKDISSMPTDTAIARARARLDERLSLSDVDDAVFVTASRDFGKDTPVLAIASRWMERLRATQPARHAAIEAALLPPAPPSPTPAVPDVGSPAPAPLAPGEGFGGGGDE